MQSNGLNSIPHNVESAEPDPHIMWSSNSSEENIISQSVEQLGYYF